MPRYFFNIRTANGELAPDKEGVDLADLDAAAREVALTVQGFHADAKRGGYDYSGCYFEIRSEDGRETLTLPAFVTRAAKA